MSNLYGETISISSPTFRRLRNDVQILAQAIHMRLNTRPGTYFDDLEYGLDLEDLLLEGVTPAAVARIGAAIAAEIEKDERVESASVRSVTTSAGSGARLSFSADVTPRTAPPFSLVISIQDLTLEVLLRGA